jgi:hypothetical protein
MRRLSVVIAAIAISAIALVGAGCSTNRDSGSGYYTNLGSGRPNAIFSLDSSHAWVVGDDLILNYNGVDWKMKKPRENASYTGVWASSPSQVWVAGSIGNNIKTMSGEILFFNGHKWMHQKQLAGMRLDGIFGLDSSHVWAFGDGGTILFFDGGGWTAQRTGVDWNVKDIWASDPDHVWAVGSGGILFCNGISWSSQWMKKSSPIFPGLNSIDGLGTDRVWAAGSADGGVSASILFFDGTEWTQQFTSPGPGSQDGEGATKVPESKVSHVDPIRSVYAVRADEVYAVSGHVVLVYDGKKWRKKEVSDGLVLTDVTSFPQPGYICAVGYSTGFDNNTSATTHEAFVYNLKEFLQH